MFSFDQIQSKIEDGLRDLQFANPPQSLYEPVKYILSLGGKRVRPALVLMACNMYKDSVEEAVMPAMALEVFHNFTLLHDDLMDKAEKRRNKPTVHKVWNENTAILSGDAMLIFAYELLGKTGTEYLGRILPLFTKTAAEICGGQQYDMEFESRMDVSEAEYLEMIRLKTAVLLACALQMGAIIGGASEQDCEKLYRFGVNIGLAFQLQDDLLDIYGNTDVFGKNIGGDILCNKKTYFLINALQQSRGEQQKELLHWLSETSFDPKEKIQAVTYIYNELRLREQTEAKIKEYFDVAVSLLSGLDVLPERKTVLVEVCSRLMNREF